MTLVCLCTKGQFHVDNKYKVLMLTKTHSYCSKTQFTSDGTVSQILLYYQQFVTKTVFVLTTILSNN